MERCMQELDKPTQSHENIKALPENIELISDL